MNQSPVSSPRSGAAPDDPLRRLVAGRMGRPASEFLALAEEEALRELARFPFCAGLVERLRQAFAAEFEHRGFYRWRLAPQDIHLAWGLARPVALQVDPDCEVLCACGREFGSWPPREDAEACLIDHLVPSSWRRGAVLEEGRISDER